jgi:hypothetical protein
LEAPRSRAARTLAEEALIRIVLHYGDTPEFVVLGGLVPDLLCSSSPFTHVGTTDVDVQVNLEIQTGTENGPRLEHALLASGFTADSAKSWRWTSRGPNRGMIKFELLADLDDVPAEVDVQFDDCDHLGAVNLRGTGFAAQDFRLRRFSAVLDNEQVAVGIRVASIAGYLLAKIHAARSRRLPKDFYDIAFVLLHHDLENIDNAARAVVASFPEQPVGSTLTALDELRSNFTHTSDQGPTAYAEQMTSEHPDLVWNQLALDAVRAVNDFADELQQHAGR